MKMLNKSAPSPIGCAQAAPGRPGLRANKRESGSLSAKLLSGVRELPTLQITLEGTAQRAPDRMKSLVRLSFLQVL